MQLGKLDISTDPDIAKSFGGGLKSSAWRHCSHFRQACHWLLDQSHKLNTLSPSQEHVRLSLHAGLPLPEGTAHI